MIRRFRWIARLLSVATGPVILFGCATRPIGLVTQTPDGSICGTSDVRTGDIAVEIARRTGFGLVVATGFTLEGDTRTRVGRRYQVNRPWEGSPGRPPSEEVATEGARRVYETFERRVREVAQGALLFYAEIHGNTHRDAAGRIEIATVGIDRDDAQRLRMRLEW